MDLTSSVLARPGAPVIRQWPPAEEREQNLLDDFFLADDDFAEFGFDAGAAGGQGARRLRDLRARGRRRRWRMDFQEQCSFNVWSSKR